jgi:hypothetical protein
VRQIRFIFVIGSDGYGRLFPSQRAPNEDELSEPPSDADLTGSLDEVNIHESITADDVLPTQFPLGNRSLVTMAEIQQLFNWISARQTDGNCPPRENVETIGLKRDISGAIVGLHVIVARASEAARSAVPDRE